MTRRVVRTSATYNDITSIAFYLFEKANPGDAERFLDAVEDTFNHLAEYPVGTFCDFGPPGMRKWPVKRPFQNYLIHYLTAEDEIRILRVLHGARDIPKLFEKGV
jgi:toxin ParE1/3/4